MLPNLRIPALALGALSLLCFQATAQITSDPFAPGMRWSHGADLSSPWIPRDVTLVADSEFTWVGEAVGTPAATLLGGTNATSLQPIFSEPLSGAIGIVDVEAGDGIDELYAAVQFPGPSLSVGRLTQVLRFDGFTPSAPIVWTRTLTPNVVGGVKLAVNASGDCILAARFDPKAGRVDIDRLAPSDGFSLFSVSFPGAGLRGLAVSADGERILVALGTGF
jgi:hypothetical protein